MSAHSDKSASGPFAKYLAKRAKSKAPPPRPQHSALTQAKGLAKEAKDFHWLEQNIPCQVACPSKTDVPGYLEAVSKGDYTGAYLINLRDNVFPAVLGRVCTRPCEPACRHGWPGLGEPVAICFSKRSAADFQERNKPVLLKKVFPPTGKSIAVIGSGVAGLATARELALWGHRVVVFEKDAQPGGMMVQGIPEFRLPRPMISLEIEQIRLLGVEMRFNVEVGKTVSVDQLRSEFDAVILATGCSHPYWPDIKGRDVEGVEHGLPFLTEVNLGRSRTIGDRAVIIGGGFTATDCARIAQRLGAREISMYYRRTEAEMYITPAEVEELKREGIAFHKQTNPVEVLSEDGRARAVRFIKTEPGPYSADGRRSFTEVPGTEFEVPADLVLLATGQRPDRGWLPKEWADKIVGEGGSGIVTLEPGLFAVGDFAAGSRTLINAIADGRNAARSVDTFLMGEERFYEAALIEDVETENTGRTREMDFLPRAEMPVLPVEQRDLPAEVETGLDDEASRIEASRCYLCNYKFEIDNDLCIYCDRCLKVKPMENCIVKVSSLIYDEAGRITGYNRSTSSKDYNLLYIDQSQCIRCGLCKEVCPVECIDLQKVTLTTVPTLQGEQANP